MKLERLQEYVLPVVATLCGMGFAVAAGYFMGQGQFGKVAMMLGGLFLGFLTMVMRQYIWLLIVVAWPWSGTIPVLPASFAVRDLAVMAVFASFLALKALKVARRKPDYELADFVMILLLVYMLTVFIRNPVGFLSMNSDRVGGRPYFNIAIACGAYFVLSRASIPFASASRMIILTLLASNYAIAGLNIIADLSPRASRVLVNFYTGLAVSEELANQNNAPALPPGEVVERQAYLGNIGNPTGVALVSFFRPITLLTPVYVVRFLVLCVCIACVLLSGFRSSMIAMGAYFAISSYLRSGWMEVVRLGVIGLVAVALLVAGQGRLFDLPLSAQRALTFLPGQWSQVAKDNAQSSSEWRFQMWRVLLKGSKYVRSHWFGDGFGVSKRDMAAIAFLQGRGNGEDNIETTMILGTVHSGPLSTIRYAGYVGLGIYLTLLVLIARFAWQLARRAQHTPFFPLALFFGLPLIYEPFNFVFIFGGFDSGLVASIYGLGILKMVSNSLNDYHGLSREVAPVSHKRIADPEYALAGAVR